MAGPQKRTRSRLRRGESGGTVLSRAAVLLVVVAAVIGFTLPSGAFSVADADRSTDVDAASDENALLGIDVADGVTVGGGGVGCGFGTNDLVVDRTRSGDVETDGCVRIESGARLNGDVNAGGDVIVESGARISGDVEAGGEVTVESGGRITGDVEERAGGDGSDGSGGRQFLLGVTNNLNGAASVTVALHDPDDGTLFADGSSGSNVRFDLAPGARQDVSIEPSDSGGDSIEFRIDIDSVGGGSSVTLRRSVDRTVVSDGDDGDCGEDDDKGHGNDCDGHDEDNPGNG